MGNDSVYWKPVPSYNKIEKFENSQMSNWIRIRKVTLVAQKGTRKWKIQSSHTQNSYNVKSKLTGDNKGTVALWFIILNIFYCIKIEKGSYTVIPKDIFNNML